MERMKLIDKRKTLRMQEEMGSKIYVEELP